MQEIEELREKEELTAKIAANMKYFEDRSRRDNRELQQLAELSAACVERLNAIQKIGLAGTDLDTMLAKTSAIVANLKTIARSEETISNTAAPESLLGKLRDLLLRSELSKAPIIAFYLTEDADVTSVEIPQELATSAEHGTISAYISGVIGQHWWLIGKVEPNNPNKWFTVDENALSNAWQQRAAHVIQERERVTA
jgi:hypothetical protein